MNLKLLKKEILDYALTQLHNKNDIFQDKQISIKQAPEIKKENDSYSEVSFSIWSEKKGIEIIEFPIYVDGKPFCTLDQAKEWIYNDIEKYLK